MFITIGGEKQILVIKRKKGMVHLTSQVHIKNLEG